MTQLEKEEIKKILSEAKDGTNYEIKYKELLLGILTDIRDELRSLRKW